MHRLYNYNGKCRFRGKYDDSKQLLLHLRHGRKTISAQNYHSRHWLIFSNDLTSDLTYDLRLLFPSSASIPHREGECKYFMIEKWRQVYQIQFSSIFEDDHEVFSSVEFITLYPRLFFRILVSSFESSLESPGVISGNILRKCLMVKS